MIVMKIIIQWGNLEDKLVDVKTSLTKNFIFVRIFKNQKTLVQFVSVIYKDTNKSGYNLNKKKNNIKYCKYLSEAQISLFIVCVCVIHSSCRNFDFEWSKYRTGIITKNFYEFI